MPALKIVTINILSDLSRWKERSVLLLKELRALSPDILALQEVRLPQNPAQWLAEQLGMEYIYLSPKSGFERTREGIAILSHLPIQYQETIELQGQHRVAQYIQLRVGNQALVLSNGHFYWQPGESASRLHQVETLIKWLKSIPGNPPCIVCGDFNATPETSAIQRMRQQFRSAHAAIHETEPAYTCPTPLPRDFWAQLRTTAGFFVLIRPKHYNPRWRGVLDYIFVDPRLRILDCEVVLNQPDPDNPRIYPSDHFGLCATILTGEV
jgi:endonuclease/exonuclease/phosphatase family metal-dependent hydrolase